MILTSLKFKKRPDPHAGGSRDDVRAHRRQHLPGRDAAAPALRLPSGSRLCELQHADSRAVPVRRGRASRRRRDGRLRLERGARDAARRLRRTQFGSNST